MCLSVCLSVSVCVCVCCACVSASVHLCVDNEPYLSEDVDEEARDLSAASFALKPSAPGAAAAGVAAAAGCEAAARLAVES